MTEELTTPLTADDGQPDVDDDQAQGHRVTFMVTMAGADEPVLVTTANPDLVAWDLHRSREKWPSHRDAPMLWMTFVAWRAMRRLNLTAVSWADFQSTHCLDIEAVDAAPVDPTQPTRVVG